MAEGKKEQPPQGEAPDPDNWKPGDPIPDGWTDKSPNGTPWVNGGIKPIQTPPPPPPIEDPPDPWSPGKSDYTTEAPSIETVLTYLVVAALLLGVTRWLMRERAVS